jgi:hypothetical protein
LRREHSSRPRIGIPPRADGKPSPAALYACYPARCRRSANGRYPPRPCENGQRVRPVPNFRGLWPRSVRKNRNNVALHGRAESGAEFSHGLRPFATSRLGQPRPQCGGYTGSERGGQQRCPAHGSIRTPRRFPISMLLSGCAPHTFAGGLIPASSAASSAPMRSRASPASARSHRARARGRRRPRLGGRSIDTASRATEPRAARRQWRLEGCLSKGGFCGIALQQDVAPQTMKQSVGRAVACLCGERKARLRGRQRVVEAAGHDLQVSNHAVRPRRAEFIASFQVGGQRLPKLLCARLRVEEAPARVARENLAHER